MNQTLFLPTEDPFPALEDLLTNINVHYFGYYQLRNLFQFADYTNKHRLIDLINNVIEKQIDHLWNDFPLITLVDYLKIVQLYNQFCNQLNGLLQLFYPVLVNKKTELNTYSTITTCQILQFYNRMNQLYPNVVEAPFFHPKYLENISMETFIQYAFSIDDFICLQNYLPPTDGVKLSMMLKLALNNCQKIHPLCNYLNSLFEKATEVYQIEKIVYLLTTYCTQTSFYSIYIKFMQSRIVAPNYAHLVLENKLIRSIHSFTVNERETALIMLEDVQQSRLTNETDYAVICTKDVWQTAGMMHLDLDLPLIIKNRLIAIETIYQNKWCSKEAIEWHLLLGSAQIKAYLGKEVTIICHMLQAIVLITANETVITLNSLQKLQFPLKLAQKILNSLVDSKILLKTNENYEANNNYEGAPLLDIRPYFLI